MSNPDPNERLTDSARLEAVRARIEAVARASVAPPAKSRPTALKVVLPLLGLVGAVIGAQWLVRHAEAPLAYLSPSAFVKSIRVPLAETSPNSTLPLPPPAQSGPIAGSPRPPSQPAAEPEATSELDLVKQGGQALQSDPARALQLMAEHAKLYPNGALAEEREAIAIDALALLGQLSTARSRAERFMVSYPRSAQLSRVQRAARLDADRAQSP